MDEMATDTLFFAGTPETIRINLRLIWRSEGGAFRVQGAPSGLVYHAYSFVEDENAPAILPPGQMAPSEREDLLRLPDLDPRIAALARSMAGDAVSDDAKARAVERRLRSDYTYTLELPTVKVRDPLAYFLFVRRKGHCEYFASAMAVMLRTLGIPSRVVTGFQSGVFNPLSGWQVVRASDAHSWVEGWTASGGWTVFDPTPPAAESSDGLISRVALLYDAANQFWQDWVLRYDLPRQVVLASRMQQSSRQLHFDWIPDTGAWWERNAAAVRRAAAILACHGRNRDSAGVLRPGAGAMVAQPPRLDPCAGAGRARLPMPPCSTSACWSCWRNADFRSRRGSLRPSLRGFCRRRKPRFWSTT